MGPVEDGEAQLSQGLYPAQHRGDTALCRQGAATRRRIILPLVCVFSGNPVPPESEAVGSPLGSPDWKIDPRTAVFESPRSHRSNASMILCMSTSFDLVANWVYVCSARRTLSEGGSAPRSCSSLHGRSQSCVPCRAGSRPDRRANAHVIP